jgi:sulfur carrier protein
LQRIAGDRFVENPVHVIAVLINGTPHSVAAEKSLEQCLVEYGAGSLRGVAVAVNEAVVPRSAWAHTVLANNDSILIITATQGG